MLKFKTPQNTRIAPSPTGKAHIGFVRTAYLNYLAARSSGGSFIVRIDDTDAERSKQEFTDDLLHTLEWLGLEWDVLEYQSKRADLYKAVAENFTKHNTAIVKDGATYFNPEKHGFLDKWTDLIAGDVAITDRDKEAVSNLVLARANGSPTYHFASCVDDAMMGVNLIIRGTDHLTNTSKHVHLFHRLAINAYPSFAHVGLIFHNGKKISKRDGLASMEYYKEKYTPEAVLNAVLKLGWSHPDPQFDKKYPLVDKQMAIELFAEGHLKAAKSTLDVNKLDWLNKRYAQRTA